MALDKLVDSAQLDAALTYEAGRLRAKLGSSAQLDFDNEKGFGDYVDAIPSGGGGGDDPIPNLKDVVFIDYDGTIIEQYTKAEFLALDSLPPNPSHSGLTAQGWNWSLSDAKTYVTANGMLVIGQNYTTSDGKTHVYISVPAPLVGSVMQLQLKTSEKGGVTIDWGDGTSEATTGNANTRKVYSHTYSAVGDYLITFARTSGTYQLGDIDGAAYGGFIVGGNGAGVSLLKKCVYKIEIGDYVTGIGPHSFESCTYLKTISIPTSVIAFNASGRGNTFLNSGVVCLVIPNGTTNLNNTVINTSQALRFISIPKTVTSYGLVDGAVHGLLMITYPPVSALPGRVCYQMQGLQKACIPGTYTAVASNYIRQCHTLASFTIPASVTSIAQHAFTEMSNIKEYHFLSTSPPALSASTSMFTLNTGTKIYVPYSADHSILAAYQTASNWSSFASYIQEEPQ